MIIVQVKLQLTTKYRCSFSVTVHNNSEHSFLVPAFVLWLFPLRLLASLVVYLGFIFELELNLPALAEAFNVPSAIHLLITLP